MKVEIGFLKNLLLVYAIAFLILKKKNIRLIVNKKKNSSIRITHTQI